MTTKKTTAKNHKIFSVTVDENTQTATAKLQSLAYHKPHKCVIVTYFVTADGQFNRIDKAVDKRNGKTVEFCDILKNQILNKIRIKIKQSEENK